MYDCLIARLYNVDWVKVHIYKINKQPRIQTLNGGSVHLTRKITGCA